MVRPVKEELEALKRSAAAITVSSEVVKVAPYEYGDDFSYRVPSCSRPNEYNIVGHNGYTVETCTCKGAQFKGWCSHMDLITSVLQQSPQYRELMGGDMDEEVHSDLDEVARVRTQEVLEESGFTVVALQTAESDQVGVVGSEDVDYRVRPFYDVLSDDQKRSFMLLLEWWKSTEGSLYAPDPFVLSGYAGVGKSFSIQQVMKAIKVMQQDVRIALVAPTHKAKGVLTKMADEAGLTNVTIATVHSLCHLIPGAYNSDGKRHLVQNPNGTGKYFLDFDLVVIDESSMLSEELINLIPYEESRYQWIEMARVERERSDVFRDYWERWNDDTEDKSVKRPYTATIFMGDPAQLPPVRDDDELGDIDAHLEDDEAWEEYHRSQISPVFTEMQAQRFTLTQVMRYSGTVATYATQLRENITSRSAIVPPSEGNLLVLPTTDWEQYMIKVFKEAKQAGDRGKVRALAWTNKRVGELNALIRNALYQNDFLDAEELNGVLTPIIPKYAVGDRLTAKEPIFNPTLDSYGKKKIWLYSTAECTVTAARVEESVIMGQLFKVYYLKLTDDSGNVLETFTIHEDSLKAFKELLKFERKKIALMPDGQAKAKAWGQFYGVLEEYNLAAKGNAIMDRLQYALASTLHQAQGSTYPIVFLDAQNVGRAAIQSPALRNQLLYVGATRCSEMLIMSHCPPRAVEERSDRPVRSVSRRR